MDALFRQGLDNVPWATFKQPTRLSDFLRLISKPCCFVVDSIGLSTQHLADVSVVLCSQHIQTHRRCSGPIAKGLRCPSQASR
ncbi:hypothetical protein CesoFtcFv8_014301 [Champsocephalus esox]|uniref:Uncharacterized protein n=1 Tax=Champsocephalus esox TaxID=159716 RepID=A0AAN8BWN0_9TELE|nr:hypothetical protein CesoFtcFv8_014301 [Champsocephalus esox]